MSKIYSLFQFVAFFLCTLFGIYNVIRCMCGDYNVAYILLFAALTAVMGNLTRLSMRELKG